VKPLYGLAARIGGALPLIVVAGIAVVVFALLGAVIVEIGQTMSHRRHLQVQADAAALAAAQEFPLCSTAPATAYNAMAAIAGQYGGFSGSASYNQQVGNASGYAGTVGSTYQSPQYPLPPAGSGYSQHAPENDSVFFNGDGSVKDQNTLTCGDGTSNSVKMFDVKASEYGIHGVFSFGPFSTVNAHARVELKPVNQATGLLPLAVPDVRPQYIFAKFIAETGTISCSGQTDPNLDPCEEELVRGAKNGNQQMWVPSNQLQVTVPTGDMGVRIRFVGNSNKYAACGTIYVECYDSGSTNGVLHVRGWDANATAPLVQGAELNAGTTCSPDAYFTVVDCFAGMSATVDLGAAHPVQRSQVWATVDGAGTYQLTVDPANPTGTGPRTWTLSAGLPISGGGPHVVKLQWQDNGPGCSGTCSGNFGGQVIQRAFEATSDRSGPLPLAQLFEGNSPFGPYSFRGGTQHSLGVTVATIGNLLLSAPTDPPINLRVFKNVAGNASQDQSLDCDPAQKNLKTEIQFGCSPWYQTQDPTKPNYLTCPFGSQQALWGSPQPWTCVAVDTGDKGGLVGPGLNLRIYGATKPKASDCTDPNKVYWIRNVGFDETAHPDDKRVLPLFVTPLGTFSGSGNTVVPLIDFGYFYVTGYEGDPCDGVDPNDDPIPKSPGGSAFVVGHFIKFFPLDNKHTSDDNCDLTTITPCVGVLTR